MPERASTPERLQAKGKRMTPERELLIDIIHSNPHLDASEIFRHARETNPRIGLATVYRTLRLLEEIDIIEARRLGEDHSHYEMHQSDHVHLVCTECGTVLDVPSPFDAREFGRRRGFEVHAPRLELVGLCAACRAATKPPGRARTS